MTLTDLLCRRDELGWGERAVLARCLDQPWCVAEALPRPGRAPLVSVRDGHGALWCLEVERAGGDAAFANRAAASADLAQRLVMVELGGLRPDLLGRSLGLSVRLVHDSAGGSPPLALDGGSFGLSVALAIASHLLGSALDRRFAASAALAPDGSLLPVDGLAEKLAVLRDWAPQVQAVLVAAEQQVPEVPGGPEVVPVARLQDAVAQVLPASDLADVLLAHLRPEDLPRLARDLFRLALHGTPHLLSWETVRRVAARVEQDLPEGQPRWQAQVAHAIAARHLGRRDADLPDRAPQPLPAALDLALLAHRVQHASDLGSPGWQALAEQAADRAVAMPGHAGTARVWGALGRLYASWGRGEAALGALERAWTEWQAQLLEAEGSHAVCEWLRVLGAMGDGQGVDRVLDGAFRQVWDDPATSAVSRSFLALAAGRALAWTDRPGPALDHLAAREATYEHARLARLRLRLMIRPDEDEQRQIESDPTSWRLLRLVRGEATALDELAADPQHGEEVARILGYRPPGQDPARFVARWWRY